MAKKKTTYRPVKDALLPLRNLQSVNEIDAILRAAISGTRKEAHEAIERVLRGWPGRKRFEAWERLRWLRNGIGNHRWQRAVWSEEDVELLRTHYARGRAGARQAVNELLGRHPDSRPESIWRKAAKLGLSAPCGERRPWTKDEEAKLLWDAGMKEVAALARKLNRSEAAVRQRLSRNGVPAKVRVPKRITLHRMSKMLGVSDSIVRVWFEKGIFDGLNGHVRPNGHGPSRVVISREALVAFCVAHPEKVNAKRCDPEVLEWLEERRIRPVPWSGFRQHLTDRGECPRCGRVVTGNAFSWHVMHCAGSPRPQRTQDHPSSHGA